jgi:membrane complex biogenesis BtpA family protein
MLDKTKYPLALVMIQPPAMPGSYLNEGQSFEEIEKYVMQEAHDIAKLGFDGFILQNMHDGPVAQKARPETIAFMTVLAAKIKTAHPDKVLGILVNWDGVASLAVAAAARADFIRVEHLYTGVSVDTLGFHYGQCAEILDMKKRLGIKMPVFADAMEINANYLAPDSKPVAARKIVKTAYADGVCMSGNSAEESLELIKETREYLPDTPIFLGGGATAENICELLKYYDGVSVATWIKNGDMRNPIDPKRAEQFLAECRKAKSWRNEN